MKYFIGYFDFLGYKKFIENNDTAHTRRRAGHILRDIESCLGRGEYAEAGNGALIADLKKSRIRCLNISDTVIFWTQDDSLESLNEFLDVCYQFNWKLNLYNFPVRGTLIYDELEMITGNQINEGGGMYNVNMIYGKGLIKAHLKADNQSWAGCAIDETLVQFVTANSTVESMLDPIAVKYLVPYRNPVENQQPEYVLSLVKGKLNELAYNNWKKDIIGVFESDNKGTEHPRVKEILDNTIKFLDVFIE